MKTNAKKKNQPTTPPQQVAASGPWKRRLLLGLLVLVVAGGTWAVFEFVVWNKLPRELVGKWEVVEGPQEGAIFHFHRSGFMVGAFDARGFVNFVEASIRVEGQNMYATTKHPKTGEELTRVQVIRTLTENELVLQDEKGQLLKMKRAD